MSPGQSSLCVGQNRAKILFSSEELILAQFFFLFSFLIGDSVVFFFYSQRSWHLFLSLVL